MLDLEQDEPVITDEEVGGAWSATGLELTGFDPVADLMRPYPAERRDFLHRVEFIGHRAIFGSIH